MNQFNLNQPQGPDAKRLLLAVFLTTSFLMVYSYFQAPERVPNVVETKAEGEEKIERKKVDSTNRHKSVHDSATANNIALFEKTVTEANDTYMRSGYDAYFTNQGGDIKGILLTGFSENKTLFDKEIKESGLIKLSSANNLITLDENAMYEVVEEEDEHVVMRHVTKEGLEIRREYDFSSYSIKEKVSFVNLAKEPIKIEPLFSALKFDDKKPAGFLSPGADVHSLAIKTKDKFKKYTLDNLAKESESFGKPIYMAFDEQFFISAIIPDYSDDISHVTLWADKKEEDKKMASIAIAIEPFILINSESKEFSHEIFVGPKQVNLLSNLKVPLDETIDFGWFGVLSRPMLWLLVRIHDFVDNYGLAIILITLIIKLLTFPLTQKSFSSQQEMKKIQPKIKELQQKYGHDRTLLGQKQMEVYKEYGINPVAGCLPLLIQLPIWFAFFQMLRNSVELYDQPFYWWITDLTMPDPYMVLPVLMGASMFIQQLFTPTPTEQPHMKYVMMGMPIFLTFIMLNMPSGLSLYILTNNLLTILQQLIIKRKYS